MRPTRRLQPRVLARVRREGVGDWLVGPKAQHVRGTEAALGQLGATLHFLVPGARAGAACPLRPEAVLSITAPASSFPEDSGSRAGTRVLRSHGSLASPSSGGELTPQSTSVESPECRHLGAASLTAPLCPPCEVVVGGMAAFQALLPLRESRYPPRAPRCWESGWRPQAVRWAGQTTASPQQASGVTHASVTARVWPRGRTCRTGSGLPPSRPAGLLEPHQGSSWG